MAKFASSSSFSFSPLPKTFRDTPNRMAQDRHRGEKSCSELNSEAARSHWYRSATIGSTRMARRAYNRQSLQHQAEGRSQRQMSADLSRTRYRVDSRSTA